MTQQLISQATLKVLQPELSLPPSSSEGITVECFNSLFSQYNPEKKLVKACRAENTNLVTALIDSGLVKNLDYRIDDISPLEAASRHSSDVMVKLLIAHGANVNYVDSQNRTPIFLAAMDGSIDIVKALHEAGANLNCKRGRYMGSNEETVLTNCLQQGKSNVAAYLIEAGADLTLTDGRGHNALHYAEKYPEIVALIKAKTTPVQTYWAVCKDGVEFPVLEPVEIDNCKAVCIVKDKSSKIPMRSVTVGPGVYPVKIHGSSGFVDSEWVGDDSFTLELPVDSKVKVEYHVVEVEHNGESGWLFYKFSPDMMVLDNGVNKPLGKVYRKM